MAAVVASAARANLVGEVAAAGGGFVYSGDPNVLYAQNGLVPGAAAGGVGYVEATSRGHPAAAASVAATPLVGSEARAVTAAAAAARAPLMVLMLRRRAAAAAASAAAAAAIL
jgi:hypothetical protein